MKKGSKVIFAVAILAIVVGVVGFILMGNRSRNIEMPEANSMSGEITSNTPISQNFKNTTNNISEIAVVFSRTYDLGENVDIVIELLIGDQILASTSINADDVQANHRTYLKPSSPITGFVNKDLTLKVYTTSSAGTGLFLMTNTDKNTSYLYGSQIENGTICFSVIGKK